MSKFKNCKVCAGKTVKVNETYELVKCENCKLIFSENIFTQEEFVAVYDILYNKENSAYQRHSKNEFDKINQGIINVGKNRGALIDENIIRGNCKNVLEIGSGIGLVGSYVKNNGRDIAYKGIELDKEAFLKSRELGLDTYNGDFTHMKNFEENFDVIMLWEVLEHLQDLKQFLALAYAKLNKGGTLILSTPNYDKIKNYSNGIKDTLYQNEPAIHLNFFTNNSLKNVVEDAVFKNCTIRIKKFPYLEKQVIRYLKII